MFKRITWGSMRGYTNRRIEAAVCKAKQNYPQFASLRIPNRIKAMASTAEGDEEDNHEVDRELSEEIDAGIDLIEAEVEEEKRAAAAAAAAAATGLVVMPENPVPAPRQQPQPQQPPTYTNMPNLSNLPPPPPPPNHPLRPAMSVDGMQVIFSSFSFSLYTNTYINQTQPNTLCDL